MICRTTASWILGSPKLPMIPEDLVLNFLDDRTPRCKPWPANSISRSAKAKAGGANRKSGARSATVTEHEAVAGGDREQGIRNKKPLSGKLRIPGLKIETWGTRHYEPRLSHVIAGSICWCSTPHDQHPTWLGKIEDNMPRRSRTFANRRG